MKFLYIQFFFIITENYNCIHKIKFLPLLVIYDPKIVASNNIRW